ncbi:MAG: hypothetical protein ACKOBW_01600 [Planctomycetota bacterium]
MPKQQNVAPGPSLNTTLEGGINPVPLACKPPVSLAVLNHDQRPADGSTL